MIVVTTPTGHIGSGVVQQLLAAQEAVRVVARDSSRLSEEVRGKVEIVQGSLEDEAAMMRALDGAESLFHLVPPAFGTPDVNRYYLDLTRPTCKAITRQGVKRVVTVSAVGRHVKIPAGVLTAAFLKDAEIERTGVNMRALWCPSFMENSLRDIPSLQHQGTFSAPIRADQKMPLVSTRDIAATAVRLLRDRSWTGQSGVAVLGPEDLSYNDMARIMTDVLGKPVQFVPVSGADYKAQLMRFGASESIADGLVEMYDAKDQGIDNSEPRTAENTTPTSFRKWCEEVLRPALQQSSQ